jgi:hypothetical protein
MANNCTTKLLKADRVFDTGCLAINSKGHILSDSNYYTEKNSLEKAIRVREAPYFDSHSYNDEQVIKVDLEKAEKAGVKYLYFYMWGDDVESRPGALNEIVDKTHYHLFDQYTNMNFHRVSNVAKLHTALQTWVPEAKEARDDDDEEPSHSNLFMGCYLAHLKEKTWTLESLKAYVRNFFVQKKGDFD